MEIRNEMSLQALCEKEGTTELKKFDVTDKNGKINFLYSLGSIKAIWATDNAQKNISEGKLAIKEGNINKAKFYFKDIVYAECKNDGLPDFDEQGRCNWVPTLKIGSFQQNTSPDLKGYSKRNEMSYEAFCEKEGTTELKKIDIVNKDDKKRILYSLGSKKFIWASDRTQKAINEGKYEFIKYAEVKDDRLPDFDNEGRSNWIPTFLYENQITISLPFRNTNGNKSQKPFDAIEAQTSRINPLYLFFDTETTGTPHIYSAPSSDTKNWPRLVQLAWILTDVKGNRILTGNLIVRPEGFVIPADATKIHGITTQKAIETGVSLKVAIILFKIAIDMAECIIGHNIDFDKKIVGAEMIRLGMKDIMDTKKSYCTMQSSIDFCKIPGGYGFKYPKLQELYKKLFGKEFDNAHNAMSDVEATEKCFWELRKRKLI